jgi:hypothetical protein
MGLSRELIRRIDRCSWADVVKHNLGGDEALGGIDSIEPLSQRLRDDD